MAIDRVFFDTSLAFVWHLLAHLETEKKSKLKKEVEEDCVVRRCTAYTYFGCCGTIVGVG